MPQRSLPLVLIPGAMSSAVAWRYQIAEFASDREVLVPDRHFELHTIQAMAHDIAPRLPPLFDLAGWSMGGYVVFELYPLVRDRVRKLTLICTSARAESSEARERRADLLRVVEAHGIRSAYECQINTNLVAPLRLDPAFREEVVTETARLGERALRSQMGAMTARRDSRGSLRQISADTLVIGARHDIVTPAECSLEMASLLPCATLHIVESAGHCAPWEASEEINGVMRRFLDGSGPCRR